MKNAIALPKSEAFRLIENIADTCSQVIQLTPTKLMYINHEYFQLANRTYKGGRWLKFTDNMLQIGCVVQNLDTDTIYAFKNKNLRWNIPIVWRKDLNFPPQSFYDRISSMLMLDIHTHTEFIEITKNFKKKHSASLSEYSKVLAASYIIRQEWKDIEKNMMAQVLDKYKLVSTSEKDERWLKMAITPLSWIEVVEFLAKTAYQTRNAKLAFQAGTMLTTRGDLEDVPLNSKWENKNEDKKAILDVGIIEGNDIYNTHNIHNIPHICLNGTLVNIKRRKEND